MYDEMKERPKIGDLVEFKSHRSSRIGKIIAVSKETDSHFLVETPFTTSRKPWEIGCELRQLRIPLSAIIRILPERS